MKIKLCKEFREEAQACAAIPSQHSDIFDVGNDEDIHYIMELVEESPKELYRKKRQARNKRSCRNSHQI